MEDRVGVAISFIIIIILLAVLIFLLNTDKFIDKQKESSKRY